MEAANEQPSGRNRRSWRNILVEPAGQLRLVFVVPMIGLFSVDLLLFILRNVVMDRLFELEGASPGNAAAIQELAERVSHVFTLGMLIVAICAVMLALCGLIISHRYYGPIVPILRSVRGMKEGQYQHRVHLRKGDELVDLANAVNALAETLEGRSGPSKET